MACSPKKTVRWGGINDPESDLTTKRVNGYYDVVRCGDSWNVHTPHGVFTHTKTHSWADGNVFLPDSPVSRDQAREFAELMIKQFK
jgi:hypothetical protein